MFMSSDTVAEQLTDCLPQVYQAYLSVKERYLEKNRVQSTFYYYLNQFYECISMECSGYKL